MAKPFSGSTAPSLGTRSRTCPYEASTSKSLPRYFLMVFALAGDSTMTRLSAISYLIVPRSRQKRKTADGPRTCVGGTRLAVSVRNVRTRIGYQILEPLERQLLSRL